jgi:hypothetical protein
MKEKIKELTTKVTEFTDKNSPALLTGATVTGIFMTAWMAFKAGPKAKEIMDRHKSMSTPETKEEKRAEAKALVKELTPVVLPPIGMGITTAVCAIGSNKISSKRIAVLSAAYSMSESALKDYQNKVTELFDVKKVQKVKEGLAKDKLEKNPMQPNHEIYLTGDGDVLCMDEYSGRYFRSNAQKIGQSINELSADLQSDMYVSLNDLYDKIGLPKVPMGDDFGWNVEDLVHGQLDINLTACLTSDKQPCLCMTYDVRPRMDFRRLQ